MTISRWKVAIFVHILFPKGPRPVATTSPPLEAIRCLALATHSGHYADGLPLPFLSGAHVSVMPDGSRIERQPFIPEQCDRQFTNDLKAWTSVTSVACK